MYGVKYYYDSDSVKHVSHGVVRVWAKSNGDTYLYEIICKDKKAHLLKEGDSQSASPWFAIVPGSEDELLYRAVCE
jgi:hypothetical protein